MKYIVVSGASGGIGYSLVKRIIERGDYVIGLDIIENDIKDERYSFIKCDITKEDSIIKAKEEIKKITSHINTIFNIAGIFMIESIVEGSTEDLRKIIDVNFFGTYSLNKNLIEYLSKGSKIIVFTSEVARYSPQPFNGYYALSKIILDKYSDVLRRELNYLDIKVIKVQSGAVKTKLLDSVNDKYYKMVDNSTFYKSPLTKLKFLMDNEINKQTNPDIITKKLIQIEESKYNKLVYRIKNSFKLSFLNSLPERLQDIIYKNIIK